MHEYHEKHDLTCVLVPDGHKHYIHLAAATVHKVHKLAHRKGNILKT